MNKNLAISKAIAEQATGCKGAGDYQDYAHSKGYKYVKVLNWMSSAGDWEFIISKDGERWQILSQTNNYPKPGFSYEISDEEFYGSAEDVLQQITDMYC